MPITGVDALDVFAAPSERPISSPSMTPCHLGHAPSSCHAGRRATDFGGFTHQEIADLLQIERQPSLGIEHSPVRGCSANFVVATTTPARLASPRD